MNTHRDKRTKRFRWVELVAAVVIPGTLAAIIVPRYTDASSGDPHLQVLALLHTIRSQLELYNVQNPATQYDETTVTDGTFWHPLLNGNLKYAAVTSRPSANTASSRLRASTTRNARMEGLGR